MKTIDLKGTDWLGGLLKAEAGEYLGSECMLRNVTTAELGLLVGRFFRQKGEKGRIKVALPKADKYLQVEFSSTGSVQVPEAHTAVKNTYVIDFRNGREGKWIASADKGLIMRNVNSCDIGHLAGELFDLFGDEITILISPVPEERHGHAVLFVNFPDAVSKEDIERIAYAFHPWQDPRKQKK